MERRDELTKDLQVNDLWLEFLGTTELLRRSSVPGAVSGSRKGGVGIGRGQEKQSISQGH